VPLLPPAHVSALLLYFVEPFAQLAT